ncbi:MAG: TetR/AcrR family transcriptional regulator [Hyphomonadaceae bacterium]
MADRIQVKGRGASALVRKQAEAVEAEEDGRRMRSNRSRERIVHAMIELIRAGEMTPAAARVAEKAKVGLRTVFRHFEEMDTLNREISAIVEAEILPLVEKPFEGPTWRAQLDELLERRAHIYERVMPLKIAGSLQRFRSKFLMDDYNRFLMMERAGLKRVLPQKIMNDAVLFHAIEMAVGFQTWRRLRQDQGLSTKDALNVMRFTVERLVTGK